jgi:hypothetical protein
MGMVTESHPQAALEAATLVEKSTTSASTPQFCQHGLHGLSISSPLSA